MDSKECVKELNAIRAQEFKMSTIYRTAAQMITGLWRDTLAAQMTEHAEQEMKHAELVMRHIVALGGTISSTSEDLPLFVDLNQIMEEIEKLEIAAIKVWQDFRKKLAPDDAFVCIVEDILMEEQHHWEEAKRWRMASDVKPTHLNSVREDLTQVTDQGLDQEEDPELDTSGYGQAVPAGGTDTYPVVGDNRRLVVISAGTSFSDNEKVGEAWQLEDGTLVGIGMCSVMLFEPVAKSMYNDSSIGMDVSPLSVLAMRLEMSPFLNISWENSDAND